MARGAARLVILAALIAAFVACDREPTSKVTLVPSSQLSPLAEAERGSDVLRVAVAPVVSPQQTLRLYRRLVDVLGQAVGRRAILIQSDSYAEVDVLLRTGQVEVAFVCTRSYVTGVLDGRIKLLAAPVVAGRRRYHSLILVPDSSPATEFSDLRGKRFAGTDILSNTGWLYPSYRALQEGPEPETFFGQVVFTGGHDRAIEAVAAGFVDGAAVDDLVYEDHMRREPALRSRLRVIDRSEPFGMPPVVTPIDMPAAQVEALRSALLGLHRTGEGRRALAPLRIDHFELPKWDAYEGVRSMIEAVRERE